ncbi:uncharacterized protein BCN122_III0009 [Burkholderia cenocepacia]|nr:uncharacterized protein BCN122_III0009 [Burkholderia cenocepacia]
MLPTKSMRPYYALSDIFVRAAIDADATSRVSMPVHTSVKDACRATSQVRTTRRGCDTPPFDCGSRGRSRIGRPAPDFRPWPRMA